MTFDMISGVSDGVWLYTSGEMTQPFTPGLVLLFALTFGSGGLVIFSFAKSVISGLRSTQLGMEARNKLRPGMSPGELLGNTLREPALPLSKDAARLPEASGMMHTYWMSWAYGLLFLASGAVFSISLVVLMASLGMI